MTLQQLKYVAEVERCGSLRKASARLYVSQPNISKQISLLEEELGIMIFRRTTSGISLTPEGQRLMQYISSILRDTEYIKDHFHETLRYPSLTVSSQHFSIASEAYGMLQQELDEKYNCYSLSLQFRQTNSIIEDVASQQSEIGLLVRDESKATSFDRIISGNNLAFQSLYEGGINVFVHKDHPLARKKGISFGDLDPYPCIIYTQDSNAPHFFTEEIALPEAHPRKMLYINDLYTSVTAMRLCNAYDLGTGFMPGHLWQEDVAIPLEGTDSLSVGYLKLKDVSLSGLAQRFISYMKQTIESGSSLLYRRSSGTDGTC